MNLLQRIGEAVMIYIIPAMLFLAFSTLVVFFITERIILIRRLGRREHRKEVIKRWRRMKKKRRMWQKKLRESIDRNRELG